MDDKLLQQLKSRVEQYKIEIDSINCKINEYRHLIEECLKLRSQIQTNDSFTHEQKTANTEMQRCHAAAKEQIILLCDKLARVDTLLKSSYEDIVDLKCNYLYMIERIQMLEQAVGALPFSESIRNLNEDLSEHKTWLRDELDEFITKTAVPMAQALAGFQETERKAKEALERSSKATETSDRVGIEIKILNRKMNQILKEPKHESK